MSCYRSRIPCVTRLLNSRQTIKGMLLIQQTINISNRKSTRLSNNSYRSFYQRGPNMNVRRLSLTFIKRICLNFMNCTKRCITHRTSTNVTCFRASYARNNLVFMFNTSNSISFQRMIFNFRLLLFGLFSILISKKHLNGYNRQRRNGRCYRYAFFRGLLLSGSLSTAGFKRAYYIFISCVLRYYCGGLLRKEATVNTILVFL